MKMMLFVNKIVFVALYIGTVHKVGGKDDEPPSKKKWKKIKSCGASSLVFVPYR